jgi:predicted alpha/beta hydrolase family esterase
MVAIPASQKSTTVRTGGPPRALRAALGAAQRVAPGLAARLAARGFLTPPRHPQPPWEAAALRGAEPFAVRAAGATIRGHRLGGGPAVLLVHGWGGRGGQLAALAPPLLAAGCGAIAFDGPAHGASGGRTADLGRFAEVIGVLARRFGARAAVGHSFGGAALVLALRRGLALDAAVLVGTPRTPRWFFDPFCAALGLEPAVRDGARRRIERRVGVAMDELDAPRLAPAFPTPTLVVHDRGDAEVPFEAAVAIAEAWQGARLLATSGLGHRRVLRDPGVAAEVAAFLLSRISRCGCGRPAAALADGAPRCETCLLSLHLANREERAPPSAFEASVDAILRAMDAEGSPLAR